MTSATGVFSISDNVSFQGMGEGEGAVILEYNSGQLHTCNDTTAAFLAAVDGKRTLDEIVTVLESQFEVDRKTLASDLNEISEHLLAEGILT